MIFGINGIETNYFDNCTVTVKKRTQTLQEWTLATSELLIVATTCIFVLLANSGFEEIKWTVYSMVIAFIAIPLVAIGSRSLDYKVTVISIFLVFITMQIMIRSRVMRFGRKGTRKMFYNARE